MHFWQKRWHNVFSPSDPQCTKQDLIVTIEAIPKDCCLRSWGRGIAFQLRERDKARRKT